MYSTCCLGFGATAASARVKVLGLGYIWIETYKDL